MAFFTATMEAHSFCLSKNLFIFQNETRKDKIKTKGDNKKNRAYFGAQ